MYGRLPYMTSMNYFARNAKHLKSVTLMGLASCTTLERFAGESNVLENVDLSGIPSTSTVSIYYAFSNCSNMKHCHLHGAGVSGAQSSFSACYKLYDTDLEDLNMDTTVISSCFNNCYCLPNLDLSN